MAQRETNILSNIDSGSLSEEFNILNYPGSPIRNSILDPKKPGLKWFPPRGLQNRESAKINTVFKYCTVNQA